MSLKETSTPVRRNRQLIAEARASGQLILPADDDGSWITASPPGTGRTQRVVRQCRPVPWRDRSPKGWGWKVPQHANIDRLRRGEKSFLSAWQLRIASSQLPPSPRQPPSMWQRRFRLQSNSRRHHAPAQTPHPRQMDVPRRRSTFRDLGADWAVLFDGTGLSARWDWEDRMGSPRPESGGSAVQWRRK